MEAAQPLVVVERRGVPAAVVQDRDPSVAEALKAGNGRENVKSARYRPILSANRRRQRPAHVYARADPAQYG